MRRRGIFAAMCLSALTAALLAGSVGAHDEFSADGDVLKDNKHALHDLSHESESEGHISQNRNYGFEVVGNLAPGGVEEGLYTDVWADGTVAYVGTFQEPRCDRAGVFVVDVADPANPELITHIKSPPDTRVNDVKTARVGDRTVLIHTLEPCGMTVPGTGRTLGQRGISLWDVTDPKRPVTLKSRFLDFGVHNTFPWTAADGRTYLILVDDEHVIDTHIVDISKPQSPRLVSSTGLPDWEGVNVDGNGGAAFLHDVWVDRVGGRDVAVLSYWDAGFIKLDVTDPANPVFLGESDYPDPDPVTGFSPPEGNAHAAVFNADRTMIFAGDEDFAPFRITFRIESGPDAGEHPAAEGAFTVPIVELEDKSMNGSTTFLGLGCDPGDTSLPPAEEDGDELTDEIAVFQRGACFFQTKAQTAENLGYDGFIVFNTEANGDAVIIMGGSGETPVPQLPGIFVGHSTGLKIFGASSAGELTIGESGEPVSATAEFDGWGYFHGLDTGSLAEIGHYAPQEVNNPDFASGFGDLTMHNVEGDPQAAGRAFVAWYSLGMRAVEHAPGFSIEEPGDEAGVNDYYASNFREVGRFIADEGSNFWGVHVLAHPNGEQYVLGSDRNTGLWIFQFGGE